ncbi:MAG: L-arabonate dehydratase [Alphaproteobacteria bacterium MarineAlpha5_Bin7]|nr:MAG: L-arabonate dehydratase [Alphaproteobacteria bacterium MarineAlpha5_Bin7]|tara:strand:- start:1257 stop:2990 length:1734 start_codon:yes stop_codon:yes gene_type:complete
MAKEKKYRSSEWYSSKSHRRDTFIHRGWMRNQGHPNHLFDGRPVIGICNTWSELTPCNGHFREIAEHVRRGVYEAGGFPLEFPVFSASESNLRPTAMLFRNLASMDVEEAIRGNPIDGVVLLMGCDKTTPSLLMGAASCDLPTIGVSGGPMLNGQHRGKTIGSGTGVWKLDADLAAGVISEDDFVEAEISMSRSKGHCMTMGTASTMASMVESLGMALPHNAAIPAVDSRRYSNAFLSGKRIVEMVKENLVMSKIITKKSFENAIKVNGAIGGSTNAVIHLAAIAGRMEIDLSLDDWEICGKEIPTLVNLQPSGDYLMEDFYYAGGLPAVIKKLLDKNLLNKESLTVNGKTLEQNNFEAVCWNEEVIRNFDNPITKDGGIKVLRGNIAPDGAILKPSAASKHLMQHTGKAVVFESVEEFHKKIHDPNLDVDENSILVLKNCGPKGYPGMAEVGNMLLPQKLLKKGVRDMIRISDARMSGTAFGTVILHTAPESAVKGPLAAVQNGDEIKIDVDNGIMELLVDEKIILERLKNYKPVLPEITSGYQKMYIDHVNQANKGADLDFLVGRRGTEVKRHSH